MKDLNVPDKNGAQEMNVIFVVSDIDDIFDIVKANYYQ